MEVVQGGSVIEAPLEHFAPPRSLVRFALVDADSGFTRVLAKRVSTLGWQPQVFAQPIPVEDLITRRLDALVIDFAVVPGAAWTYLEELSGKCPTVAVIVCTGQSTVAERVRGLRLGADDWVTKPCHPEEVLARMEAALRKRRHATRTEVTKPLVAGELEIRPNMFEAFVGGSPVGLTRREFELLQTLAAAGGTVVPRERIYQQVWGYSMVHGDRSVDVFVRRLRKKLEAASPGWTYLHTHFGVGYRFGPQERQLDGQPESEHGPSTGLPGG
jgi:DNA-binding response OmpR family regulator